MKSLDQRPLSQRVLLTNVVAVGGVLLGFAVSDVKPSARVCVYIAVLIVALMNLMFLVVRPRLFALRAAGATALNPFRTFYEVLKEIRNSGIRIMGQCRERDNNNGVKPVDEYCAVSMSKRLGHGFSTLSGKTAAHLSRYDARAKESLVAWQSKQTSYSTRTKQTQSTGDPCGSVRPTGADGSFDFDFDFSGIICDGPTFRDLFDQFFRRR